MTTATAPSRTGARRRGATAADSRRCVVPPRERSSRRRIIGPETSSLSAPTGNEHSTLREAPSGRAVIRSRSGSFESDGSLSPTRPRRPRRPCARSHVGGRQPAPWLSPTPITNRMLGLPATVRACLFDVEGVLTDSSRLHAWAWGEVFDDFLSRLGETTGWHLIPFDRVADYRAYVEGRSRLEGVNTFLRSRGIRVREGRPDEPRDADSAHGLARRKGELLERRLHEQAVTALPVARRYLEAARRAGVMRAAVYESASTLPMLEQAGLASLGKCADRWGGGQRRRLALAPRSGPPARCLPSPRHDAGTHCHLHGQRRRRRRRTSRGHVDRGSWRCAPVRVARGVRRRPGHSVAGCASRPAADDCARQRTVVPGTPFSVRTDACGRRLSARTGRGTPRSRAGSRRGSGRSASEDLQHHAPQGRAGYRSFGEQSSTCDRSDRVEVESLVLEVMGELVELIRDLRAPGPTLSESSFGRARRNTPYARCAPPGPRSSVPQGWCTRRGRRRVGPRDPNVARWHGCQAPPPRCPRRRAASRAAGTTQSRRVMRRGLHRRDRRPGARRGGVPRAAASKSSTARACMSGRCELAFGSARLDRQTNRDADAACDEAFLMRAGCDALGRSLAAFVGLDVHVEVEDDEPRDCRPCFGRARLRRYESREWEHRGDARLPAP